MFYRIRLRHYCMNCIAMFVQRFMYLLISENLCDFDTTLLSLYIYICYLLVLYFCALRRRRYLVNGK